MTGARTKEEIGRPWTEEGSRLRCRSPQSRRDWAMRTGNHAAVGPPVELRSARTPRGRPRITCPAELSSEIEITVWRGSSKAANASTAGQVSSTGASGAGSAGSTKGCKPHASDRETAAPREQLNPDTACGDATGVLADGVGALIVGIGAGIPGEILQKAQDFRHAIGRQGGPKSAGDAGRRTRISGDAGAREICAAAPMRGV